MVINKKLGHKRRRLISIIIMSIPVLGICSVCTPSGLSYQSAQALRKIEPIKLIGWKHYDEYAALAAKRHGVPADMFLRLLHVENYEGNPLAVNPRSGATGLAQFMPATAAIFKIDPRDPHDSILASARYLRDLYRRFSNWEHAVMAYNWGPVNVGRWIDGGMTSSIPAETAAYVRRIEP